MKILKKGKLPEDKVYTAECLNCGTEFEFKRNEGRVVHDQRDGDAIVAVCPECDCEVWVAL